MPISDPSDLWPSGCSAFARRLAAAGTDLQLSLWNRTRERAEQVGVGAVAPSPAEAVRDAELVITSLTNREAVRAAYLGRDGALPPRAGGSSSR